MFNFVTNFIAFIVLIIFLVVEFFVAKALYFSQVILWSFTIFVYMLFLFIQFVSRASVETEKAKIKGIIDELYYTINGIPLLNKNDILVIKWDIIFKKLIDRKEYSLYDKIVKTKTSIIDEYVNKYPSLLLENTDLNESKYNLDLNSEVTGKGKKPKEEDKELVNIEEYKANLFIKEIDADKAVISNFDNSIHMDVLLNNEYYADDKELLKMEANTTYDGFSVHVLYNKNRYTIVPRFMVSGREIDKEKWFLKNINRMLESAKKILKKDDHYVIQVSETNINSFLKKASFDSLAIYNKFEYLSLEDKYLIFKSKQGSPDKITLYCEFDTSHNNFEIKTVKYEKDTNGQKEIIEIEKTIALGSSYQPLITLLERMPNIINNINLIMNNQDLTDIVIR